MVSRDENKLPLTDAELHILLVLSNGDSHGYGMMKSINNLGDNFFTIGPATLYRTIQRLCEKTLIIEIDDRPDVEFDDERRRYYRLTEKGQRVLSAEARRLAQLVKLVEDWEIP